MSLIRIIADPFNLTRVSDLENFSRHLSIQLDHAYDHIRQLRAERRVQYIVRKHERFEHGYHKRFTIVSSHADYEDAFFEAQRLNDESDLFQFTIEKLEAV